MKKTLSIFFFALMVAIFIFELYFGINGAIAVSNQYAELAEREASGHEYLGTGLDILVLGVLFISAVGSLVAMISRKIAQFRWMKTASFITCMVFLLPIFSAFVLFTI